MSSPRGSTARQQQGAWGFSGSEAGSSGGAYFRDGQQPQQRPQQQINPQMQRWLQETPKQMHWNAIGEFPERTGYNSGAYLYGNAGYDASRREGNGPRI